MTFNAWNVRNWKIWEKFLLLYPYQYETRCCFSFLARGINGVHATSGCFIDSTQKKENIWAFYEDKRNCLLYICTGVFINRVSLERGSTGLSTDKRQNKRTATKLSKM